MPALALFDFDGTLTKKDTLLEFIKYYKNKFNFYTGLFLLSPVLILFKLKLIKNWKAKEIVLSYFFKDEPYEKFQSICDTFSNDIVPGLVRPEALSKMLWHIERGDQVIIVSASAENWIVEWSKKYHVDLLATRLEIKNQRLTGKISGVNCYGPEKVARVKAFLSTKSYNEVYGYGDSAGDTELLEYCTHPHYRCF